MKFDFETNLTVNSLSFQINDASLGLGRDFLLKGLNDSLVNGYYKYAVNLTVYFGANRSVAEEEVKKVVEFEIKVANVSH